MVPSHRSASQRESRGGHGPINISDHRNEGATRYVRVCRPAAAVRQWLYGGADAGYAGGLPISRRPRGGTRVRRAARIVIGGGKHDSLSICKAIVTSLFPISLSLSTYAHLPFLRSAYFAPGQKAVHCPPHRATRAPHGAHVRSERRRPDLLPIVDDQRRRLGLPPALTALGDTESHRPRALPKRATQR